MNKYIKSLLKVLGLTSLKLVGLSIMILGIALASVEPGVLSIILFIVGWSIIDLTPSWLKFMWQDCKERVE